MKRQLSPAALLLLASLTAMGCTPAGKPSTEGPHDGHEEAGPQAEGPRPEIHLSAEAIERAGIQIGKVERRALFGGVAIPAEVQFEPTSTAHVGPLVSGRITKVTVSLGEAVKAGQLLGVVASNDVSAARARLAQVQAQLGAAESTVARQQQLVDEGIGAQRSLIDATAREGELRAEVAGLKSQLELFGSAGSGGLTLTSPIDGIIVALHGTLGETATPEQPVFIITDPTKVWIRGNVPELQIQKAQVGSPGVVRLHAFPDVTLEGKISYVAPSIDEASRSLPITLTLTKPDARLRSGLYGTIELLSEGAEERPLVIPKEALATLDGQDVVFVPADEPGSFRAAPVLIGRSSGGLLEVKSGLDSGAPFAQTGAFTLKSAFHGAALDDGHDH